MPMITVRLWEGTTFEVKRGLVRDITEAVVKNLECPPEAVSIDMPEYRLDQLARGGKLSVDDEILSAEFKKKRSH